MCAYWGVGRGWGWRWDPAAHQVFEYSRDNYCYVYSWVSGWQTPDRDTWLMSRCYSCSGSVCLRLHRGIGDFRSFTLHPVVNYWDLSHPDSKCVYTRRYSLVLASFCIPRSKSLNASKCVYHSLPPPTFSTSPHYHRRSLGPFSLPCAQKWP